VWVVWLILAWVTAACAGSKGTGIYETLSLEEKKKVLEELKRRKATVELATSYPADKCR